MTHNMQGTVTNIVHDDRSRASLPIFESPPHWLPSRSLFDSKLAHKETPIAELGPSPAFPLRSELPVNCLLLQQSYASLVIRAMVDSRV
jgi:hypothetical protein